MTIGTAVKTPYGSDDFTILDLSGRVMAGEPFSLSGNYIQCLPESTGPIEIALGAAGSGAPKRLKLEPGDRIILDNPNRPFQSLYITIEQATQVAKLLIANSGVQFVPGPGNIEIVGGVDTTPRYPILGQLPYDPKTIFADNGAIKAGRAIRDTFRSTPSSTTSWLHMPANDARFDRGGFGGLGFQYIVTIGADPGGNINELYPCEAGDIIYFEHLSVIAGLWTRSSDTSGAIRDLDNVTRAASGLAIGIRQSDGGIVTSVGLGDFEGRLTNPDNMLRTPQTLNQQRLLNEPERQATASLNIRDKYVWVTASPLQLVVDLGIPDIGSGTAYFSTANPTAGKTPCWYKPPVSINIKAVLLKPGVDF